MQANKQLACLPLRARKVTGVPRERTHETGEKDKALGLVWNLGNEIIPH